MRGADREGRRQLSNGGGVAEVGVVTRWGECYKRGERGGKASVKLRWNGGHNGTSDEGEGRLP